jgi:hypothetical protein
MEASSYADRLEGLSNARNRQHRIVVALPTTAHAQQFSANAGAQYCIYHSQHPRRRSGQDQFSDSVDLSTRQSSSACMYARDGVVSADLLVRGIYWRIWRYLWVLACWHSYGKSLAAGVTSQASDWPFHGWTPPQHSILRLFSFSIMAVELASSSRSDFFRSSKAFLVVAEAQHVPQTWLSSNAGHRFRKRGKSYFNPAYRL